MGDYGPDCGAVSQDDQRERLALAVLHIRQQRFNGMERVAIDGLDGVPGAHACLIRGHTRLHFLNADGTCLLLAHNAGIARDKLIFFGRVRHMKAQLQDFAAALDRNRYGLVSVQLEAI